MFKTILCSTLVIIAFSGCFHKEPQPKKEVKKEEPQKIYYKVPKLNPSFYYN